MENLHRVLRCLYGQVQPTVTSLLTGRFTVTPITPVATITFTSRPDDRLGPGGPMRVPRDCEGPYDVVDVFFLVPPIYERERVVRFEEVLPNAQNTIV